MSETGVILKQRPADQRLYPGWAVETEYLVEWHGGGPRTGVPRRYRRWCAPQQIVESDPKIGQTVTYKEGHDARS